MAGDGIVGIILAGGGSRRMGGREKFALELAGERLVERAARRLAPQVDSLVVAANRDVGGGLSWCADVIGGGLGPLAGLHAGLLWAGDHLPDFRAAASVPVDCPFFPQDLVRRLEAAGAPAVARDSERRHPVFGLWPAEIAGALQARLESGERLAVEALADDLGAASVLFPKANAFFNINRPADLEEAARLLAQGS